MSEFRWGLTPCYDALVDQYRPLNDDDDVTTKLLTCESKLLEREVEKGTVKPLPKTKIRNERISQQGENALRNPVIRMAVTLEAVISIVVMLMARAVIVAVLMVIVLMTVMDAL